MERLSISLDDKSYKVIERYEEKYNTTKADIVRKAIKYLCIVEEATEKVPLENINIYIDYLAEMEHVIVDIAYWELIFSEIGEGSKEFWEEVYEIGEDHGTEYYDKGIKDVKQILKYVEKTNWYKLKIDSENSYTLILPVSISSRFVKTFLEGFFKNQPRKVTITEEHKKIRIKIH